MAKNYGNKQQMEKEGANFKALKPGSYIAKFSSMKIEEKQDFHGQLVPTLCLQFAPYEANARAAVMKDIDGATVKPLTRKLFQDINKVTMGFRENFTIPSKYRSLVAALQNVDPNEDVLGPDELTVESAYDQLEEFFGEYVLVTVITPEKKGVKRNKITDFLPVPEDFEADPVVEATLEDAKKKAAANKADDAEEETLDEETEEDAPAAADDSEEEDDEEEDPPKPSKGKGKKPTRKALF